MQEAVRGRKADREDYGLESTGKIKMAKGRYTEQGRKKCQNLQSDCEPE